MSEISWFEEYGGVNNEYAGRYIRPYGMSRYTLKLYRHVYPNDNYTYLALPFDRAMLLMFLRQVIAEEGLETELGLTPSERPG